MTRGSSACILQYILTSSRSHINVLLVYARTWLSYLKAGIANTLLSFGRRRASPPCNVLGLEVDTAITEVPTVMQTLATPVILLSPNDLFHTTVEDEHEFSTTITQPVFQSPPHNTLDLLAEYAGESMESSVTDKRAYLRYQGQITDTLCVMTDQLAALSTQPPAHCAPPEP